MQYWTTVHQVRLPTNSLIQKGIQVSNDKSAAICEFITVAIHLLIYHIYIAHKYDFFMG